MREFFKPWRRNAGCVTLVLACVFTAGWIRSLFVLDAITFRSGVSTFHLVLPNDQTLAWLLAGQHQVRNVWSNISCWNLNQWCSRSSN